ncbi:hypothetical protein GY45DRAFT_27569 [Cubamyces sp. BRFM 1775]|nr:hypothetical protein GY45DRAFT_27569 [Cubamyces sp. BRFM 1775]
MCTHLLHAMVPLELLLGAYPVSYSSAYLSCNTVRVPHCFGVVSGPCCYDRLSFPMHLVAADVVSSTAWAAGILHHLPVPSDPELIPNCLFAANIQHSGIFSSPFGQTYGFRPTCMRLFAGFLRLIRMSITRTGSTYCHCCCRLNLRSHFQHCSSASHGVEGISALDLLGVS